MSAIKYIIQPAKSGGWEVKKSSSQKASFTSKTKKEAQDYIANLKAAEGKTIEERDKSGKVTKTRVKKNSPTSAKAESKSKKESKPTEVKKTTKPVEPKKESKPTEATKADEKRLHDIKVELGLVEGEKIEEGSDKVVSVEDKEHKEQTKKSIKELQAKNPDVDYSKPSLEVKAFTKRYKGAKVPAVENVEFKVMPGEFHGFIGANGAGKTTTIKSLIGAYAKFQGSVTMFGHKHSSIQAKKRIGYIPEAAKFPKGMSTLDYIAYMSYLSGMNMRQAKKYAKEKLVELGLDKVMKRSPNTFSSGQKKKVLLAQALVHDPDIIIMDEPAANLDPKARFEFFEELKDLQRQGKSIFISSHILAELDKFVDSVTIVDGGKIVFTGSMAKATENPEMEYFIKPEDKQDNKKILEFAKKNKLKSKKENGGYVIWMINRENIINAMRAFAQEKIIIDTFKNKKMSLEEVYEKYVLLGSRETGTGKVGKDA